MTVAELIARLQQCDQSAHVVIGYEGIQAYTIKDVETGWTGIRWQRGNRLPHYSMAHNASNPPKASDDPYLAEDDITESDVAAIVLRTDE